VHGFFLDVNVLVALSWPSHVSHPAVERWFGKHAAQGWATCPLTQCGFVRVISNPAFSPYALSPKEALELLQRNLQHLAHRLWADDIDLLEAEEILGSRIVGHQQVTDAFLLGLAIHRQGKLATLDKRILSFPGPSASRHVELIA
jgi:uncharacterized protein